MHLFLETLKTSVVLWHVVAFGFGFVYVINSYRAILGYMTPRKYWKRILRRADLHLWLSGVAVIAVGILLSGATQYFSNPKLWTKIVVITVWLASTQFMRRYAMLRYLRGKKAPMLTASSVNVACWFYGAFLGCAKGLANGAVPFEALAAGFVLTLAVSFGFTMLVYLKASERKSLAA